MRIRRETDADRAAVDRVHTEAFATDAGDVPVEVGLLAALRADPAWLPHLSLVAVDDTGAVVGHVVCTRAAVERTTPPGPGLPAVGLGPVGVLPDAQGRGVGSALLHAVLGAADARDEPLVGLLGEPELYRRFGFVAAADLGVAAPDPGWGAYFQVRLLSAAPPEMAGRFRYAAPFDDL